MLLWALSATRPVLQYEAAIYLHHSDFLIPACIETFVPCFPQRFALRGWLLVAAIGINAATSAQMLKQVRLGVSGLRSGGHAFAHLGRYALLYDPRPYTPYTWPELRRQDTFEEALRPDQSI